MIRKGQRFGRLVVLESQVYAKAKVSCRCDCGAEKGVYPSRLKTGHIKSCGCTHHKEARDRTPEYTTWRGMKERCWNPHHKNFHLYGGCGVTLCGRWMDYQNFLADMGRKPSPKHSIDRINPNGNYEPENCRWATQREQALNTRRTIILSALGQTMPLFEWAKRLSIPYGTLRHYILIYKWTLDDVILHPPPRRSH